MSVSVIAAFADSVIGARAGRTLKIVEHGCKFSLHDLFNGIRTMEGVLLCRGVLLTILAGNVEEFAEVSP